MVSRHKRAVQRDLYSRAAAVLDTEPRVLILPGRAPKFEIDCIRKTMPGAHVTAFDRDPVAVRTAVAAGVDDAVCGELLNIDRCGAPERLYQSFDFVNTDLCSNIPGTNRWHRPTAWLDSTINKAAGRSRKLFAAFVACSHEEFDYLQVPRREVDGFARKVRSKLGIFDAVSDNVRLRVLALWSQVWHHDMEPVRVYQYRGRGVPMIVAVFGRGLPRWAPFFTKHGYEGRLLDG